MGPPQQLVEAKRASPRTTDPSLVGTRAGCCDPRVPPAPVTPPALHARTTRSTWSGNTGLYGDVTATIAYSMHLVTPSTLQRYSSNDPLTLTVTVLDYHQQIITGVWVGGWGGTTTGRERGRYRGSSCWSLRRVQMVPPAQGGHPGSSGGLQFVRWGSEVHFEAIGCGTNHCEQGQGGSKHCYAALLSCTSARLGTPLITCG